MENVEFCYLLVEGDVFVARLRHQSQIDELRSPPGQRSGNEGNTGKTSRGQHKRWIPHDVLDVLPVGSGLHVMGSFTLSTLRVANQGDQDHRDDAQNGSDPKGPRPRSEEFGRFRADDVSGWRDS